MRDLINDVILRWFCCSAGAHGSDLYQNSHGHLHLNPNYRYNHTTPTGLTRHHDRRNSKADPKSHNITSFYL